ncbi:MAG: hypothetical protein CL607_23140 [Anaerolineaceae bacterium]|nr:hypothetical protein [Anaerolineaceae bacterium]
MEQTNYGSDTILIVDDEPRNLKLLNDLLQRNGYIVQAARDGHTALAAAENHLPHLILLDINMPEINGFDVCKKLKESESTRDIPVIFISALSRTDDIVEGFRVGGVDYITKPFQFEEVLARITTHLTLVHQRDQLIFQQEQIEEMRHRDRERFDKLMQMREQFVRAAAHDLKNPLTLVSGYARMMRQEQKVRTDPDLIHFVDEIEHSGKDMLHLINSMLDVIYIQNSVDLQREPIQIKYFLQEAVKSHEMNAADHDIKLTMDLPDDEAVADIDQKFMRRVIDNLVSNAIKYSEDGSEIKIIMEAEDNWISIHVEDEGAGIPEYELPHLFEPFYRAKQPREDIEGSGLGLSIVKEVVERHRGRVAVQSEVGKGSKFSIFFPM